MWKKIGDMSEDHIEEKGCSINLGASFLALLIRECLLLSIKIIGLNGNLLQTLFTVKYTM